VSARFRLTVIRAAVVALVCAVTASTLWGLSVAVGSLGFTEPGTTHVALGGPLPELAPGAVPVVALQAPVAPQAVAGAPDPLLDWAQRTAGLVPVAPVELAEFATAEITAQAETPDCQLSWITIAAVSRAEPDLSPAEAARTLCSDGRSTGDEAGWTAAVRSVQDDTAFLHRVLAIATSYADAIRTGIPINPAATRALDFAVDQIGLPYIWGGNGPQGGDAGFDCSGLTTAAYATAGITLPRTAHTQYFSTERVAGDGLLPGDLVFYGNPAVKVHHVGMYLGNGLMVNAPTFGMPVQVATLVAGGSDLSGAGRPA
jgi:cell wall-associated NlpC family hydrolase